LWAVLDPADDSLDYAFETLTAARDHCRDSWPGIESHIVPYAPATSRRSYRYTPKATSVAGGEVTRLDALKTEALAWATEVAWKAGHVAGRADAEAEGLAAGSAAREALQDARRSAMLRTLLYAYELHVLRAVAWATEAEGWDSGDVDDADKLRARRRMTLHQRAVGRIGRLALGLPAFKLSRLVGGLPASKGAK